MLLRLLECVLGVASLQHSCNDDGARMRLTRLIDDDWALSLLTVATDRPEDDGRMNESFPGFFDSAEWLSEPR